MLSKASEIMVLPKCSQHGEMYLRPIAKQTDEQKYCGVWYDCHNCSVSVLFMSQQLQSIYKEESQ